MTSGSATRDMKRARSRLERLLVENIVPFWFPDTIDSDGGFLHNHDLKGRYLGPHPRSSVIQARNTWFFARLARSPHGTSDHLEAAARGLRFLMDRMWDPEHGGIFFEVGDEQGVVTRPIKHIESHVYSLYACSEYAIVSKETEAAEIAGKIYELLVTKMYDREYGGYVHSSTRDWTSPRKRGSWEKRAGAHMHVLEAFATYFTLTGDAEVKDRISELMVILTHSLVSHETKMCLEFFNRDWTPQRVRHEISFGHGLETVWFLRDASKRTGISDLALHLWYEHVFDYCMRFGWDKQSGGFYAAGFPHRRAHDRTKIWWVQAEALVCAAYMFQLTADARYERTFIRLLDWIEESQANWDQGEWFENVVERPFRRPKRVGGLAHSAKGAYHTGRSMLESLEILEGM